MLRYPMCMTLYDCIFSFYIIFLFVHSNEFKDFNKQSAFIDEVINPLREIWTSEEMTQ